jgi:hypothetical protein
MIPDAGFVFSIAGLNASLAGLGGLLIGLRRGADARPLDTLRLRQVVEFAFANLLLAISVQPFVMLLGSDGGFRLSAGLALVSIIVALPILQRRVARVGISWGRWWAASAIVLTAVGAVLAAATVIAPAAGTYELLMIVMLARPMVTFLLVLGAIDEPDPVSAGGPAR